MNNRYGCYQVVNGRTMIFATEEEKDEFMLEETKEKTPLEACTELYKYLKEKVRNCKYEDLHVLLLDAMQETKEASCAKSMFIRRSANSPGYCSYDMRINSYTISRGFFEVGFNFYTLAIVEDLVMCCYRIRGGLDFTTPKLIKQVKKELRKK